MTQVSKFIIAGFTALTLSTALSVSADAGFHMGGSHAGSGSSLGRSLASKPQFGGMAKDHGRNFGKLGADHGRTVARKNDRPEIGDRKRHDRDDIPREHRRDRDEPRIEIVTLLDPPIITIDRGGPQVIGEDPKGGSGGTTVSKPAACKWVAVGVTITSYGRGMTDKEHTSWIKKLEDKAIDAAKDFVKKKGTALGKGVLKAVVENITINQAVDVIVSYACIDDGNNVVATQVRILTDEYSMNWWAGGKIVEGHDSDKAQAIQKNTPRTQPVAKK
jgi:hypothetical protein